jgi:Zn-dependent M28 family amino/carboxypeptidase
MRRTVIFQTCAIAGVLGAIGSAALVAQTATRAAASAPGRASTPATPVAIDRIRSNAIAAHVKFLADDLLEGRAPATRGGDLAAKYIASEFERIGLEPAGENGTYFQPVPIVESTTRPGLTLTARGGTGRSESFTAPTDFVAGSGLEASAIPIDAPIVFVNHGIVAPEYQWNDYAGLDVKGKIVLAMVNEPAAPASEPALFAGKALTYYGRWIYKFEEAARQGAAGAILIHTPESATYPWAVVQNSWGGTTYGIPAAPGEPRLALKAWATDAAAKRLVAAGGQDLDALRKGAFTRGAKPVDLGVTLIGSLEQQVQRKISPNVIGVLKGTKPDESIIYSGHYDHLGMRATGDGDRIYNGARDNASGVAAILEIAEALVATRPKPARSIYFVSTTGEESGLLGSEYLALHPVMPIDKVAANINIDSLNVYGPSRELVLLGVERSSLLADVQAAVARWHRTLGEDEHPERGYFFRSDHFPLAKAGVPAVSITMGNSASFTGPNAARARKLSDAYNETCYHQPCDEFSKDWDLTGAVEDLQLLADLGWRVANDAKMPRYKPTEQFARPRAPASSR